MSGIDLHTHTTFSDGTYSPAELIDLASQKGLNAIAVTDHDTVDGLPEALAQGRSIGLEVIPGVELSIEYDLPDHGHIHLLGLFLDPSSPELNQGLAWLRTKRDERTPKILDLLNDHGIHIPEDEIRIRAGQGSVGRPHIARFLLEKGHVSSMQEAFDSYLKKGAPAYVPKEKFPLEKAIDMVRSASGLPILAHPYSLKLKGVELREFISSMKDMGLAGLEAYYSNHSEEQTQEYLALAAELDLCVSGGTDFHGDNKPDIMLGTGLGDLSIPHSVLTCLRDRLCE